MGLIALLFLLFKGGKQVVAKYGSIQLVDYNLESSGNYFEMPSATAYEQWQTIGTVVKSPIAEKYNEVLIRSSKNPKIYHAVPVEVLNQFTNYKPA